MLVSGTHGEVDADYRIEGGLERARILSGSFGSPNMLVEVIQPDASRIFFGGGAEWAVSAHRYVQGEAGAQVLEETESTLSWLLRRTRDATGNTVDYRYERSTPRDTSSPAAEVLPVRIEYPGFQPLPRDLSGGFTAGARRIELRYAQYRDRASIQYVSGFPLLSERLLTAIDTSGPLDNTRRWTLRHYDLEYETSALTGRPRLASLRECDGHFDPLTPTSSLGCLRPTYFEYSDGDISFTEAPALGMPLPPGWGGLDEGYDQGFWSYAPSYVVPIDLGDGRDSLLYWTRPDPEGPWTWQLRRSTGEALLPAEPTALPELLPERGYARYVQPMAVDLDGDGRAEIVGRSVDTLDPRDPSASLRTSVWGGAPPFAPIIDDVGSCSTSASAATSFYAWLGGTMPAYILDAQGDGLSDMVVPCPYNRVQLEDPVRYAWPLRARSSDGTWAPPAETPVFGMRDSYGVFVEQWETGLRRVLQTYTVDLEGDGRHEVLMGTDINDPPGANAEWHIARLEGTARAVSAISLSTDDEYIFLDANGDGLRDAVSVQRVPDVADPNVPFFEAVAPRLHMSTGRGFLPGVPLVEAASAPDELVRLRPSDFRIVDLNGDGRDDLVLLIAAPPPGGSHRLRAFVSTGRSYIEVSSGLQPGAAFGSRNNAPFDYGPGWQYHGQSASRSWPLTRPLGINGDSRPDWMYPLADQQGDRLVTLVNTTPRADLLVRVDDQTEGTEVEYTTLADRVTHRVTDAACPSYMTCPRRGGLLVSRLRRGDGLGEFREWLYGYEDARVDTAGRGWIGFRVTRVEEVGRFNIRQRTFDPETRVVEGGVIHYPYASVPRVDIALQSISTFKSRLNLTIREQSRVSAAGFDDINHFVTRSRTERTLSADVPRSCTSSSCWDILTDALHTVASFDQNALPLHTIRWVSGGSRTDTRYRRLSGDDPYRVGLVDQVTSTSYPNAGDLSRSATRVLERELDPATNQTVSETIFNVSGGRDSTITFLRDTSSMGQVTRIEVAGFEPSGFEDTSWTPFSRTVDIGYDGEWIYPRTATNGLGLVEETWIHPLLGVEMEHVTAAGDRTTSTYDGFGRLVSQQASTGSGVDVTYSPSELGWMDVLVEGTDGSTSFSTLDVLGREISSGQELMNAGIPRSSEVTRQYDHFGRLTRIYNPRFDGVPLDGTPYVEMEYDNIDRPAVMYAQDRTYMQWIYTGRRTTQRDFRGNSTRTILDPELRVQSTVEGAGGLRTDYEYGFFGEVERVTAGGQVWEYDTAGSFQLPEATVDPDAGRREYLFNTLGEIQAERDAVGNVSRITRDLAGRVTRIDTMSQGATTWEWDGLDGPGRLDRACSHVGTSANTCVDYEYTEAGQVARETRTVAGIGSLRTDYSYTSAGQLRQIIYPTLTGGGARPRVRYRYEDSTGMLSRVEDPISGLPYLDIRSRNEWGAVLSERMGRLTATSGIQTNNTYEPDDGRLSVTQSTARNAGSLVQRIGYTYDPNGNVASRRVSGGTASGATNEAYTYDRLNRLTGWTRTGTPSETYRYDSFGNPTTMAGATQSFGGEGYGPHQLRRGAGMTSDVTYDNAGRVEQSGPNLYSWTSFGLPAAINQSGSVTQYTYGPDHERVRRQDSVQDVVYGGDLYERRIDSGVTSHVFHVFAGGREVAQIQRSAGVDTVAFLMSDLLGSATTIASAAGDVIQRNATNPWGARIGAASGNFRHRFTGHESEDAFGTINMRGRIYDPRTGRFLSPDPVTQSPHHAQGLNRYSYVFNNPASAADPTGMWCDGLSYSVCPDGSTVSPEGPAGPEVIGTSPFGDVYAPAPGTADIFGVTPQVARQAAAHMESGVLGFSGGGLTVLGTGFLVGAIGGGVEGLGTWAFGAAVGSVLGTGVVVVIGVALVAYGAWNLYEAVVGGQVGGVSARIWEGRATPDDTYVLSSIAGGLFVGGATGARPMSLGRMGARGVVLRALAGPGRVAVAAPTLVRPTEIEVAYDLSVGNPDLLVDYGPRVPTRSEGFFNFVVHSDAEFAYTSRQGTPIRARELARAIWGAEGYAGDPVRLISCSAGANCFGLAHRLSLELGVPVQAATEAVAVAPDGTYTTTGIWRLFGGGG